MPLRETKHPAWALVPTAPLPFSHISNLCAFLQMQRPLFELVFPENTFEHTVSEGGHKVCAVSRSPALLGALCEAERCAAACGRNKKGFRGSRIQQGSNVTCMLAEVEALFKHTGSKAPGHRNEIKVTTSIFTTHSDDQMAALDARVRHPMNKSSIPASVLARWNATGLKQKAWDECESNIFPTLQ